MSEGLPVPRLRRPGSDPWYVRAVLISTLFLIVGVLIVVPLVSVFAQAFAKGFPAYYQALTEDADTRHSIFLTLMVAPIAVAWNTLFGVSASWLIARYRFTGRAILTTLIDLPFSVSPVVAGLVFVLLFGLQAPAGSWLHEHGYRIIFSPPGLVLATMFTTFPFIARELIPVLEAVGPEEELAARSLGASGWQMFFWVTLPNIRWGLLYGIILCNARAMGEFGAVYVVSGRIGGGTDTMPLRVEKLFQEYHTSAAYAVASVLTLLSLVTLFLKVSVQKKIHTETEALAKAKEA